jgi:hypothetical protein
MEHLRRFCSRSRETKDPRRQGVVTAMRVMLASPSLLFDVSNLAVRRDFPIVARYAPTSKRCESEQTNKAHHTKLPMRRRSKSCTAEVQENTTAAPNAGR